MVIMLVEEKDSKSMEEIMEKIRRLVEKDRKSGKFSRHRRYPEDFFKKIRRRQEVEETSPKKFEKPLGKTEPRNIVKIGNAYYVSIPDHWRKKHNLDLEEIEELYVTCGKNIKIHHPDENERLNKIMGNEIEKD